MVGWQVVHRRVCIAFLHVGWMVLGSWPVGVPDLVRQGVGID
jgi:hypothetical protein